MSSKTKQILSLAKLETQTLEDPLQLFYSGIKSQETKNAYKKILRELLNSIEDFEGSFEDKAKQFINFARQEPEKLKQKICCISETKIRKAH